MKSYSTLFARTAVSAAISTTLLLSAPAMAQVTTATIRGAIEGVNQSIYTGAEIVATEVTSGYKHKATVNENGSYVLAGMRAGTYDVVITTQDGQTQSQRVSAQVGQSLALDFMLGDDIERIEVTGMRSLVEMKTSEIGTNISRQQIESMPQNSRNFLNFARLAPGIKLSTDPQRQQFQSGALSANQTNYFIDGVNMKNNLNGGGGIGQDSSRGSPFSQMSVQGFRVITQNFKAEYEQAGSAIISAITRSGTNEFEAEAFYSFQNESMITQDKFAKERGDEKPDFGRKQFGAAIGGPIIKDTLHYFVSYEGNRQQRYSTVTLGGAANEADRARWSSYEGQFSTPFEEDLVFGKLSYQPDDKQNMDLSVSIRSEADTREVGGQNTIEHARDVVNDSTTLVFKHQYMLENGGLNEFSVNYLNSEWSETPQSETPKLVYQGVINLGGHTWRQDANQKSITVRNNYTFPYFNWHGDHLVKIGIKAARYEYEQAKLDHRNPEFLYQKDDNGNFTDIPTNVRYAPLSAHLKGDNWQYGIFIQDDWDITSQLQLNIGLRYDYETDSVNKDFVTPDHLATTLREIEAINNDQAALQQIYTDKAAANPWMASVAAALENGITANNPSWFEADRYITDGNDRKPYTKGFQPRIGFSYDVFDNEETVVYAGAGRYVDRTLYNFVADESIRFLNPQYTVNFSESGGGDTVAWDSRYLSPSNLDGLIETGYLGAEMLLMPNDIEPVISDQFNVGVRQQLGDFTTSMSLSYVKSDNGLSYHMVNQLQNRPSLDWWQFPYTVENSQVGNILVADNDIKTRYKALYFTADKPFNQESGWGMSLAYTLSSAKDKGDTFNLDFPSAEDTPWGYAPSHSRHHLVISGQLALPWEIMLSVIGSYDSGLAYDTYYIHEPSNPYDFIRPGEGEKEAFMPIDVRLSKTFAIGEHKLSAMFEVFNIFNDVEYTGYSSWSAPWITDFGEPNAVNSESTRRMQFSISYKL